MSLREEIAATLKARSWYELADKPDWYERIADALLPLLTREIARERDDYEKLLAEPFYAGTRVTNCVAHSRLDFHSRPKDCDLCRTDIANHLSFAIRVNEFLNKKVDTTLAALRARREEPAP